MTHDLTFSRSHVLQAQVIPHATPKARDFANMEEALLMYLDIAGISISQTWYYTYIP